MNIDRSRFLVLTAALAAASSATGCTIIDERGQDAGGTSDTGSNDDTGTVTTDTAPADGGTDVATDTTPGDATSDATDAKDATDADTGPTCDDSVGTPKACTLVVGTGCTSAATSCPTWVANTKAKIAERTVDCLIAMPTCEGTGIDPSDCLIDALATACADDTAATLCQTWKDECSTNGTPVDASFTTEGCALQINGLSAAGRDQIHTCFVTEGSCGTAGGLASIEACTRAF